MQCGKISLCIVQLYVLYLLQYSSEDESRRQKEKEKEKEKRVEESLRKREEEVQKTLAGSLRDRDKEREQHKRDEAVQHFKALLADMVRHLSNIIWFL